jgi:hypothetical protein
MHAQRSSSPEQIDSAIMALLIEWSEIWVIVEVEREVGDPLAVRDSLNRLRGAGLIHEIDMEFVLASRAARLAGEVPRS